MSSARYALLGKAHPCSCPMPYTTKAFLLRMLLASERASLSKLNFLESRVVGYCAISVLAIRPYGRGVQRTGLLGSRLGRTYHVGDLESRWVSSVCGQVPGTSQTAEQMMTWCRAVRWKVYCVRGVIGNAGIA
ncbi:hypothetical protein BU24DRAFT_199084 [Aaosphaeria arxii CBS 175.79]|uniref:Uncharacterized protein n=1 Tax=Aaosphaeria arxii CBS 175.79 TaxID=1450172 RepID=A0A6A5XTS2_9PLEO|nr:uncharacterized protein BU24DRAFT_199084 [Aaosphaeria arxii CBS 175.79]KAF2016309.1 hypothetical protein BU24DRAFT_199084 [Aaosphaeria arxii CBS 175.79]